MQYMTLCACGMKSPQAELTCTSVVAWRAVYLWVQAKNVSFFSYLLHRGPISNHCSLITIFAVNILHTEKIFFDDHNFRQEQTARRYDAKV